MKVYKYTGTGNNGTIAWILQRISAIVLVIALGYHFYGRIMSYTGFEGFDGSNKFLLSALLVFILFHAFNGLKMITDDYVSKPGTRFILSLIYWFLGLTLLVVVIASGTVTVISQ